MDSWVFNIIGEVNQSDSLWTSMKIAAGLTMLNLSDESAGMVFHPVVIGEDGEWVLVDTGLPGHYEAIKELVRQEGYTSPAPAAVVLTHQDLDHVGSLPQFIAASGETLKVYAHEEDRPYIDGELPLLKMRPGMEEMLQKMLSEQTYTDFRRAFSRETPAHVTHTFVDGDVLPFGGGLTVVHTPGHTPGHTSLYHANSKTLIAGDALIVHNGELHGPVLQATPDMDTALKSVRKFKDYDIETVICYHGGVFKGDVQKRIDELTAHVR